VATAHTRSRLAHERSMLGHGRLVTEHGAARHNHGRARRTPRRLVIELRRPMPEHESPVVEHRATRAGRDGPAAQRQQRIGSGMRTFAVSVPLKNLLDRWKTPPSAGVRAAIKNRLARRSAIGSAVE